VLLDENLMVLAPASHSLAQLAHVRQEDLLGAHLITFPADYNVRRITDEWFRREGSAPIVAAETGAVEVMLELISAGLGVAIMPRSLASRGLASGMRALRMTPDDSPRRVVAAVHRRNGRNADLVGAMMRALEVHARGSSRSAAPTGEGGTA
jgi:DNA-binding transcriptional LysR family regulator